jgi:DNA-binding IscR family transcriptional regulator
VEALEGSIAPIECISQAADGSIVCARESDLEHVCPTKLLWTRVRFSIVNTLRETTLADLLIGADGHRAGGHRAGGHRAGGHPIPTGAILPSLDIEPLTTGA